MFHDHRVSPSLVQLVDFRSLNCSALAFGFLLVLCFDLFLQLELFCIGFFFRSSLIDRFLHLQSKLFCIGFLSTNSQPGLPYLSLPASRTSKFPTEEHMIIFVWNSRWGRRLAPISRLLTCTVQFSQSQQQKCSRTATCGRLSQQALREKAMWFMNFGTRTISAALSVDSMALSTLTSQ